MSDVISFLRILKIYSCYEPYPDGSIELSYEVEFPQDLVQNCSEEERVEQAELAIYMALKRKFELPES
jgi:hypothetical protein